MKSVMFLFIALVFGRVAAANDEKYVAAMTQNIEAIYKAETTEAIQAAINAFERIGNAEKSKWEPFYYSSFGYVLLATRESDGAKKDALLDLAKQTLDKATALLPNDSELVAMEGFIHMIKLTVDPATRGPQYSMLAMQAFGKAVSLNPNNPRALSLLAQMQLGTARFFNQPTTEACETASRAMKLFDAPASENKLAPAWGRGMTESMLANCK